MRPPTAAKITISIDGTMPTKRRRHEADLQREHRAADAAEHRGEAEDEDLEVGDVVAGEAHPVFLVAHRQQQPAELARSGSSAQSRMRAEQQHDVDEVEDVLGRVGADVPAEQGLQVGDAVDAAGVALLADDQDREDRARAPA